MKTVTCATMIMLFAAFGCSKKTEATGAAGTNAKPSAAEAPALTKLAKLGLMAELGSGASVGDGIGENSVMITGGDVGAMEVALAAATDPATLEAAKEEAKMYSPVNIKTETLSDGWLMTFENKGELGVNYSVGSLRTIGGKKVKCGSMVSSPAQQSGVVKACKSLRP